MQEERLGDAIVKHDAPRLPIYNIVANGGGDGDGDEHQHGSNWGAFVAALLRLVKIRVGFQAERAIGTAHAAISCAARIVPGNVHGEGTETTSANARDCQASGELKWSAKRGPAIILPHGRRSSRRRHHIPPPLRLHLQGHGLACGTKEDERQYPLLVCSEKSVVPKFGQIVLTL